jgi:HPt (histidine-containing phosphotransfer) domain-containing protein
MEHPGGGKTRCRACAWRISKYGVGFLWSGYVHPGTQCEIELMSIWGSKELIRGVVRGCRHLDGTVHELDVRFLLQGNQPIDLGRLVRDDAALARLAAKDTSPKSLSGRMAFFDQSALMIELVTKLLSGTSMEVVGLREESQLLETVKTSRVDMVLFTDTAGVVEGEGSLIARLRGVPYRGSIIIVTGETDRNRLDAMRRAGATGTLQKPFDRDTLMGAMARWLDRGRKSGEAVYSQLANDESVRPLLKQFIDEAKSEAERVRAAASNGEVDNARLICRSLAGSSGCFGFTELETAANEVVKSLDATHSIDESMQQIMRLSEVAQRLQPTPAPAKKAG